MAVFIEITTDPFKDVFNAQAAAGRQRGRAGLSSVRRPLRGIEIKDDTYAVFRVIRSDGTEIPLLDSGDSSGQNTFFSNFIIQSLQETRMEKSQIIETFGETFIFFFGEQPRFIDVSALLINSNDFNWKAEFLANYDRYLRGTKLTELGACAYLFYDDNVVSGYLMQCAIQDTAEPSKELVQLTFRMVLCGYNNVSLVGDPSFPIRSSVNLPANLNAGDLTDVLDEGQINQLVRSGAGIGGEVVDGQFFHYDNIQRDVPLRGLIAANRDEWTGEPPQLRNESIDPFVSTVEEVRDINRAIAAVLPPLGVGEDYALGPDFMDDSGTGPSFTDGGVGAGFGSSAPPGATFGASFGYSAGFSAGVSATAGAGFSASASASASAVITGQATGGVGVGGGYSPGASLGVGAGAGVSAGASFAGATGAGAAVSVGGDLTAFAFISGPGDLDDSPEAYAKLQAVAAAQYSVYFSESF